ncbi:unnamed protein product, partial [Chrysoparadoxa australica]
FTLPEDAEIIELKFQFVWKHEDGVYCAVPFEKIDSISDEDYEEYYAFWRAQAKNGRLKLISAINPKTPSSKTKRDKAVKVLPEIFSHSAIIVDSVLAKMAMNLFLGFKQPIDYNIKSFSNFASAKKWVSSV